ncbi:MAG: heme-binding protein, partial [Pseudomonadota bacterium]
MRWVLIVVALLAVVVLAGVLWTEWQMAGIEEPDYTVEMAEGSFEVRQYAPMLVASTNVSGERQEAASKGFSPLAGFIFGDNKPKAKIEMTAPVVQEPEREGAKIE